MNQLEEEHDTRGDPDDPFNGTANGIFQPLQNNLALAPPIQTAKRQENGSKHSKSLRKSMRSGQETSTAGMNREKNEAEIQTQCVLCELSKHLLESLDHMQSI